MSATVTTDIYCDLCEEFADDAAHTGDMIRIKDTRARAAWIGWRFVRSHDKLYDICPDCAEKYNDEELRDKLKPL